METFLGNNKVQLFKKLTRPFMNHKKLETKSVVWKNGNRNVILTVWQDKIKTILTCYLFICLFIFNQVPLSSTRFFNLNVCRIICNLSAIFIPGCPKMVVQEIRGKRSPLPSWIKLKKHSVALIDMNVVHLLVTYVSTLKLVMIFTIWLALVCAIYSQITLFPSQ